MAERDLGMMNLKHIMDSSEWERWNEEICAVSESFRDIIGVIAVGSLVHSVNAPEDFYHQRRIGLLGSAYESIRNPWRRKTEKLSNFCVKNIYNNMV